MLWAVCKTASVPVLRGRARGRLWAPWPYCTKTEPFKTEPGAPLLLYEGEVATGRTGMTSGPGHVTLLLQAEWAEQGPWWEGCTTLDAGMELLQQRTSACGSTAMCVPYKRPGAQL